MKLLDIFSFPRSSLGMQFVTLLRHGSQLRPYLDFHVNQMDLIKFLQILILLTFSFNSFAAVEYKKFDTPQQEEAYKVLIEELRCLVCQNQTIADSNAELAQDLRRQVYEMLQQGKSKDEIADFMTQRYGDFVLYNPPFKAKTGLLWIGPVVFLLIGMVMLVLFSRRKRIVESSKTSDAEVKKVEEKKAKVRDLLRKGDHR